MHSGYNVIRVNEPTNEWVLQVDNKEIVTSCNRNGGQCGWQLYGISRWTAEDGLKLGRWTEEEFLVKKNINIYWDEVALYLHHDDFKLGIYKMKPDSVFEIDGIEELKAIDNSYKEGF